jgi:hypothetical protein
MVAGQRLIALKDSVRLLPRMFRWGIGVTFLVGLGLRMVWWIGVPLWQQPDEYPHFYYIQHIANEGALPTSKPVFPYYEGYQPPAYYCMAAGVYSLFPELDFQRGTMGDSMVVDWRDDGFQPKNPIAYVMRGLSVVLWIGTFLAGLLFLMKLTPLAHNEILLAMGFLSLLPTYVSNTASITNDNLAVFFSTLFMWSIISIGERPLQKNIFLPGTLLGCALLSKYNCFVLILGMVLFFLCYQRHDWKKGLGILIVAFIVVSPWMLHTLGTFGRLFAMNPGAEHAVSVEMGRFLHASRNLFWSFWAAAGRTYEIHLPVWHYVVVFGGISALSGFGLLRHLSERDEREDRLLCRTSLWFLAVLVIAVAASLWYTLSYSVMTSWGKNLFVWIVPTSFLVAVGWSRISSRRWWLMLLPVILLLSNLVYVFVYVLPYFRV